MKAIAGLVIIIADCLLSFAGCMLQDPCQDEIFRRPHHVKQVIESHNLPSSAPSCSLAFHRKGITLHLKPQSLQGGVTRLYVPAQAPVEETRQSRSSSSSKLTCHPHPGTA